MNKRCFFIFTLIAFLINLQFISADETKKELPKIVIIATGGTIAGSGTSETQTTGYNSGALPVESLINAIPELNNMAIISGEQPVSIDSSNITTEIWLQLAKRINTLLASDEVDGIVVTHGTDTLEETAYFLNLVVKSEKPVVVVGAMRPATAMSADGPMNLYNSVAVASSKEAKGKGVIVILNDVINSARDVTKTNTSMPDTFKSPELGYLGYIQNGTPYFYRETKKVHTINTEFNIMNCETLPEVEILYGYADSNPVIVKTLVENGVKGIVYAGMGNGNISDEITEVLIEAQKKGVIIVRSSRVGNGIVTRNGELNDDELDFVTSDNLNPQKARILLMLALTETEEPWKIQEMFWKY